MMQFGTTLTQSPTTLQSLTAKLAFISDGINVLSSDNNI